MKRASAPGRTTLPSCRPAASAGALFSRRNLVVGLLAGPLGQSAVNRVRPHVDVDPAELHAQVADLDGADAEQAQDRGVDVGGSDALDGDVGGAACHVLAGLRAADGRVVGR